MAASMQKMTAAKSKAFHVSKLLSKLPRKQTTHYLERSSINHSLRCGIVSPSANSSYHFKGLDRMIPRQQQQHHAIFDRRRLILRSDNAVSCFSVLLTNGLQPHHFRPTSVNFSQIRAYSSESENDDRDDRPQKQSRRPFKLMDFQEIIWPSPFRTIRNYFFSFLISTYFDRTFSLKGFLGGGAQAVQFVSGRLAEGEFDSLDGMVSTEALEEIQNNYADLSYTQKRSLAVRAEDLYIKFVYEIGMIFDDDTNQRFVEITAVFQGFPGFRDLYEQTGPEYYQYIMENQDKVFVCNYRFIREFTKGVESDWTINKLNHFSPLDVPVKF